MQKTINYIFSKSTNPLVKKIDRFIKEQYEVYNVLYYVDKYVVPKDMDVEELEELAEINDFESLDDMLDTMTDEMNNMLADVKSGWVVWLENGYDVVGVATDRDNGYLTDNFDKAIMFENNNLAEEYIENELKDYFNDMKYEYVVQYADISCGIYLE